MQLVRLPPVPIPAPPKYDGACHPIDCFETILAQ
jgi:hypothetical protein